MGALEASIAGAPVRILRMTFSGELAYEVHTPSDFGLPVWEALLEAGAPWDIMPYGTEALGVLRIEKGHVVAGELDGRTVPSDFGFERLQRPDSDFIGKRSLERPGLAKENRHGFVGLRSVDGRRIPRGAQLVVSAARPRPVRMLGARDRHLLQPEPRPAHRARPPRRRGALPGGDPPCVLAPRRGERAGRGGPPGVHRPGGREGAWMRRGESRA